MRTITTIREGIESLEVFEDHSPTAIIFFHGYGANMRDLYPLWELWHKPGFHWYFPNGVLPLAMGGFEGRAWFSIDLQKLQASLERGESRDLKGTIPKEFSSTLNQCERYIEEVSKKHQKIILGGFSQGAMCASHLSLRTKKPLDALILLSGSLIAEDLFKAQEIPTPFYQSHGIHDQVLPISGAQDLEKKLKDLKMKGQLEMFSGGHEIPNKVITEVKSFLDYLPL